MVMDNIIIHRREVDEGNSIIIISDNITELPFFTKTIKKVFFAFCVPAVKA
jgi:hypothetical protein